MKTPTFRRARLRLDPRSYKELHVAILGRDGWRCQYCGSRRDLQVHHIRSRGLLGDDAEDNLITLCATCHQRIHRKNPRAQNQTDSSNSTVPATHLGSSESL